MLYNSVVARDSILRYLEYEPKQIRTWGSDARCLGEIWKFHSLSLPVWSVFPVNSINMDQTWMSNMNFLCYLTIEIPQLPCLLRMAKTVSSTFKLVHSVNSDSANWFNFAIEAFASKCLPIVLVPCSDGCQRTWWQTIHIMPHLLLSSIPQFKLNRNEGACLELFRTIGRF